MAACARVDGGVVACPGVAHCSLRVFNFFARAAARVGPAFGDQGVERRLISIAALRLPHHRCIRYQAAFCKLLQDELIGACYTAWCVYVFHAYQPLPSVRACIEPAGEGCNERARVERARRRGRKATDVAHRKITRVARV